jgi:endo-alpha-1,4-polygalactosaminidase (GH114 family)
MPATIRHARDRVIIDRLLDVIARTWIIVTTQNAIARFALLLRKQKGISEKSSNEAIAFGDDVQYLVESQITLKKLYLLKNLDLPVYTHDYTIFRWRRETGKIVLKSNILIVENDISPIPEPHCQGLRS